MSMTPEPEIPDYYRRIYHRWYKLFAPFYDLFIRSFFFVFNGGFGGERRGREKVIEWLDLRPGEKVLDMCSGTGTLTLMLGKKLHGMAEVIGIEISPYQLRIAVKKPASDGVRFIKGDVQRVPFADAYFDRVVISGALHEMPREVRATVLSEAQRVMKPEGRIVVVEHHRPARRWKALMFDLAERLNPEYPTYRDLLDYSLAGELEHAGFRITRKEIICWEFFEILAGEKSTASDTPE